MVVFPLQKMCISTFKASIQLDHQAALKFGWKMTNFACRQKRANWYPNNNFRDQEFN